MDPARENLIRCQRVSWLLQELDEVVAAWVEHRHRADSNSEGQYVGRQATQLAAVKTLIEGSTEVLQDELDRIDLGSARGEVFQRSRELADAVVWLERLWRYFGLRFDQRDSPDRAAATVAAADEVVWSCYRVAYEHPRVKAMDLPPQPPPLAYVEPEYSPGARVAGDPLGRDLTPSAAIEALDEIAGELPVPLLRLPPWCVNAPWWLVFIAHEVGHHLEEELGLVGPFRDVVEAAASEAGAEGDDVGRWGRWGEELFADLCSLLLMGPWALWALVEVERRRRPEMTRRRVRYPSSLVRLRVMARWLDQLGLDPAPALRGVEVNVPAEASPQLLLDAAVGDALTPLVSHSWGALGNLPNLLRFDAADFRPGGEVSRWGGRLLADGDLDPPRHLDTGRRLVAGAVAAWGQLGEDTPVGELRERSRRLANRTIQGVCAGSPPGTRSALMPDGANREPGRRAGAKFLELAARSREMESEA